jgi:hypothetical protein
VTWFDADPFSPASSKKKRTYLMSIRWWILQ